ncbi:uncharacterized mitochondrial protein-like protein [Tanacetum coccineum]
MKGIKREFSVARTPQQNGVAERKNRTLIEAARTMLADLKLPTTFWAEAVNTACRKPTLIFMIPFGCLVTILNTIDHIGKFDEKADEGFFVGYSTNSKAFRVFNSRTRIVDENLHVNFIVARNQSNGNAGKKACDDAGKTRMETVPSKDYILLPLWTQDLPFSSSSKDSPDVGFKPSGRRKRRMLKIQGMKIVRTNNIKIVSPTVNAASIVDNVVAENIVYGCADNLNMPKLEEIGRFSDAEDDISGADMNNLDTYFQFGSSDVKTSRIPMETQKALFKDADGEDVDEHLFRSMIGSLMYLTSSTPDIMFAVCACARFQVNPKVSHLYAVRRIFRYLKGQPKLGLWYPKDSPFHLVAYTDNDYAGASLDRKSIIGGCQFQGCRLISWQCKKQTMVANSTAKVEYTVASNCCITYYCWATAGSVNAVRLNLVLLVQVNAVEVAKRQEKDFSGRDTPLFPTMIVQVQEQEGEGSEMPIVPQHTPTINQPSSLQPQKKQKPRKSKKQNTKVSQTSDPIEPMADETENVESVPTHSNDPLLSGEERQQLNELMELCTNLSQRVIDLENTKTSQAIEITKLKKEAFCKTYSRRSEKKTTN